jgi:hypothetical protein
MGHEELHDSVGIVPIRVSFSTTFVLRLEVWHPDSLVPVQSLGDLRSLAPYVDVTLPVSRRRCSNRGNLQRLDADQECDAHIPMQQYQLDC